MHETKVIGCRTGCQEVGRCCTRSESQETYISHVHLHQVQIKLSTLAVKSMRGGGRGVSPKGQNRSINWYPPKCNTDFSMESCSAAIATPSTGEE